MKNQEERTSFWDARPLPAPDRAADATRAFRAALGLSQSRAARLLGVPFPTLRGWEGGVVPSQWPAFVRSMWLHLAAQQGDDAARDWAKRVLSMTPAPVRRQLAALEADRRYVERQIAEVASSPTARLMWQNRLAELDQQIAEFAKGQTA